MSAFFDMDLTGKTVLVVGASGMSGLAAARMLGGLGARVVLADRSVEPRAPSELAGLNVLDLRPRDDPALIQDVKPDLIVTAPGVPLANELFKIASSEEIQIFGENDLAFELICQHWPRAPFTVAVTGTDGKSTTTALLAHCIQASTGVRAIPCGNFGKPLAAVFEDEEARAGPTVLVVECSSFQLEPTRFFHPDVALILNLAEDHLDRYADLDAYLNAKLNLLINCTDADCFLAPSSIIARARDRFGGDFKVRARAVDCGAPGPSVSFAGQDLLPSAQVRLRGNHNFCNITFALLALEDLARRTGWNVDRGKLADALANFQGLEHRMEICGRAGALEFINDSKATTVHAVLSGVASLGAGETDGRVFLLVGGREKGADFGPLARLPARIFPFGESAGLIARVISADIQYTNLAQAFAAALEMAWRDTDRGRLPGSLILSPGCASYDEFRNYAARGQAFRDLVRDFLSRDGTNHNESREGA